MMLASLPPPASTRLSTGVLLQPSPDPSSVRVHALPWFDKLTTRGGASA